MFHARFKSQGGKREAGKTLSPPVTRAGKLDSRKPTCGILLSRPDNAKVPNTSACSAQLYGVDGCNIEMLQIVRDSPMVSYPSQGYLTPDHTIVKSAS